MQKIRHTNSKVQWTTNAELRQVKIKRNTRPIHGMDKVRHNVQMRINNDGFTGPQGYTQCTRQVDERGTHSTLVCRHNPSSRTITEPMTHEPVSLVENYG